jgi:SNF2 family DNA or RNA helicase
MKLSKEQLDYLMTLPSNQIVPEYNRFVQEHEAKWNPHFFVSPFKHYTLDKLREMISTRFPYTPKYMLDKVDYNVYWQNLLKPYRDLSNFIPEVSILPHQQLVANFLTSTVYTEAKVNKGLLIVHQTGSGKTLTAIHACIELMKKYPDKTCLVITPLSVKPHFRKELTHYGLHESESRFEFMSFHNLNAKEDSEIYRLFLDKILVIDEVHNLRNFKAQRTRTAILGTTIAFKVLLLSATPIVNSLKDLEPPLAMIWGSTVPTFYKGEFINSIVDVFGRDFTHYTFSFYKRAANDPNYPKIREHKVPVELTGKYLDSYKMYDAANIRELLTIHGNINALVRMTEDSAGMPKMIHYNNMRRAGDAGYLYETPKLVWILDHLLTSKRKTVIYSFWIECGLVPIMYCLDLLKARDDVKQYRSFEYRSITGSVSEDQRAVIIQEFNAGVVDILLVSSAGGEGIDLFGVRDFIVLEVGWNAAKTKQARDRAVRYRSHMHLPPEERFVDVYHLILHDPTEDLPTIDEIMYLRYVNPKQEIEDQVMAQIEAVSIEKLL